MFDDDKGQNGRKLFGFGIGQKLKPHIVNGTHVVLWHDAEKKKVHIRLFDQRKDASLFFQGKSEEGKEIFDMQWGDEIPKILISLPEQSQKQQAKNMIRTAGDKQICDFLQERAFLMGLLDRRCMPVIDSYQL